MSGPKPNVIVLTRLPSSLDEIIDMLAAMGQADRDRVLTKLDVLREVIAEHPPGPIEAAYVFTEAAQRMGLFGVRQ